VRQLQYLDFVSYCPGFTYASFLLFQIFLVQVKYWETRNTRNQLTDNAQNIAERDKRSAKTTRDKLRIMRYGDGGQGMMQRKKSMVGMDDELVD